MPPDSGPVGISLDCWFTAASQTRRVHVTKGLNLNNTADIEKEAFRCMPPFSLITGFLIFTDFQRLSCQMLSNAVKCCKYLIICNFFLETHSLIC